MKKHWWIVLILVFALAVPAVANQVMRVYVDGQLVDTDVPPQVIDGRTMLPARAIAEALGKDVEWNSETGQVFISGGMSELEMAEKISAEWAASGHQQSLAGPSGRGIGCAKCHDGYGFLVQDDPDKFDPERLTGIGCQTCHTGYGKELLDTGVVTYMVGDTAILDNYEAGQGALCLSCHNGNRDVQDLYAQSAAGELGRLSYPHYGMTGGLFIGELGMEIEGVSYSSSFAHVNIENTCVSCHMPETEDGYMEHSFTMNEAYIDQTCGSCHVGIDTYNLYGFQDNIKEMLDKIETAILADTGASEIDAGGGQFIFRDADGEQMDAADISHEAYVAAYNWRMVKYDGSYGVHNPRYARSLLQESYKLLTGEEL